MSKSFGKRLLAIVLSVLMIMTLLPTGIVAADSDSYEYSYTFNDVSIGGYGHNGVVDEETGTITLTYSGQYQELQFSLPDELNANSLLSISFDVTSGDTSGLVVKVIATDDSNDIAGWGTSSKTLTDDEIATVSAAESVTIGLMYNGTDENVEYTVTGFTVTVSEEAATSSDTGSTFPAAIDGYTITASQEMTSSDTISILGDADFSDESQYLIIYFDMQDDSYVGWGPLGLYSVNDYTSESDAIMGSSDGLVLNSNGYMIVSLVDIATAFTNAGFSAADGIVLNWWADGWSAYLQGVALATTATSSGSTLDTGDYDFSDYTVAGTATFTDFSATNWGSQSFDMAIIEALNTEGSLLVITRSEYDADAGYDKFLLIDTWWSMSDSNGDAKWLSLGTSITKISDNDGVDIDCLFDNGTTVVYDGAAVYAALMELNLNTSSGAEMSLISNSGSTSYSITSVTAYVPTTSAGEETETTDTSSWFVCLQGYNTEWGGWAYTTNSDPGVLSYTASLQTILDANELDLTEFGGVQFSVNGLTLTEDGTAGISDGVTLYYRVYINDELYISSSSEITTNTTYSNYTFLTLNYEANFGWDYYYNYSADDVIYVEVSLTAFEEDEQSEVTLPWVDEAVAENTLTVSGQTWWYGLIFCSEAAENEAGTYDAGVSADLDGFLSAIALDDATIEITSTGSGVDQIFFQKHSDYSGTDSLNMTVVDNGDGTYTSTLSGAELSAYAVALTEDGDSVWKVLINKTTDCDTVITSVQVVEGSVEVDEEFDLSSYTLWSSDEINLASSGWSTYDYSDSSWFEALSADGAILVINRSTDSVTFSSEDVWDKFGFGWSEEGDWVDLGTNTSSGCAVSKMFDNGSMVVYSGSSLYSAVESAGVTPTQFIINSTADTYTVTSVCVYIPTATIIAANEEMIENLTALLLSYDDVVYINQSDADDADGYFSAGWSEICASSWDWDEIASIWTTSLGDEATVAIGYTDYVAPVAGTTDDLDGTDGSLTLTYYAYVGDSEAGTYVSTDIYSVTIVIKATQMYSITVPDDVTGATVTSSASCANEGEEITITLDIEEGYALSSFTVYEVVYDEDTGYTTWYWTEYTDNGDGTYTFTMPAGNIEVQASVGSLSISYEYNDEYGYLGGASYANEGETSVISVYAYRGYELSGDVTAVDEEGNAVTLDLQSWAYTLDFGNGPMTVYTYYFTMPASAVTVNAPFAEIEGFTNNIIIIYDNGTYSYIEDVDFTAEDVYLEITYTQNDSDHDGWEPGCIYACSWNWISSFPSYYESNGTYVISLADLAALAAENGYDANDGIMIQLWDDGDDDYVTITSAALVTDYHNVTINVSDGTTTTTTTTIGKANGTAYVTIPVDSGYALGSVVATDADGNEIALTITDCGEHEYTFSMPDADVTIEATLIPDSELTEVVSWYYNGYSYNLSGDGILDNEYTDYADEELYLVFIYDYDSVDDRTIGSIGYGVGEYWNWLCDIPVNENGRTYISLSELAAAAGELGYIGEYYAYAGTLDWDSMGYAIVTAGDLLEVNFEVTGGTGETIGWTSGLLKEDHAITAYIDVESGYILRSITATDEEGNEVELTRKYYDTYEDVTCTFTMPATNVTISIELISEDDLTTVVTEESSYDSIYTTGELGSPILYNQYADFTDPDLYIAIDYTAKDGYEDYFTVAQICYQTDDENVYCDVYRFLNNGTGKSYAALSDIQASMEASGITDGVLCIWVYSDQFIVNSVSIVSLGDYEAEDSSVGELITIDGVEYEVTWDTTTANPINTMHGNSNGLGYSSSNYSAWDDVFGSFAEAVVSHIGDGSLVLTESEPQAYARLQLNTNDYLILETEVHYYGDTATYISIDEAAELAASEDVNSELTVDTLNSLQIDPWVSYDENGSVNISAVKILTPHEYEVDSWTWSEDYSSATLKLVCTEGTHTEYVTATVTPETTDATCTEDGQIVYNAVAAAEDGNIYTDSITVVLPATGHTEADAVEENRVEATCTVDGSYDSVVYCSVCGAELSRETVTLPATGHSYEAVVTDPTCEEDGYTTYTCSVCGDTYTDDTTAAIGHSYGEPEWTWDGYTSATATFTCENDSTHVVTITVTGDDIIDVTTEPTCEEEGETVHSALVTFNGETYSNAVTEALEATGHDWSVEYSWSEDGSSCTATHICANDETHNVTATATITSDTKTDATCEEMGTTTYTASFTEDWAETQTLDVVDIEATGHDWSVTYSWSEDGSSCTATHVCANDASHNVTATATITSATKTAATCTEKGTTTYTATFDADWAETQTLDVQDIDATGHTYGDPEFTWDEEACTATATFSCTVDGCDGATTVTADVTSVTTDANCTEDGKTVYTAVVTFNETEYTDTYEVTIPATGHTTEIQGYVAATCTEDGYTGDEVCTVCGETVTVGEVIPAAHSYDENGVCTVCGAKMDDSTETGNPLVTVESEDVIFASVLPSGLVTDVTVKLDVDGGTVVVSKVIEDDSNPHLVEHIADTLSFTLYNEEQGDDLVKDTNSFTITDTVNNQTVLRKASILFYGDIAYDGTSASVSMTFTSNVSLAGYDIYVLHYTGTGVVWEVVTNTATISGMTVTVDFTATSFSPYVVVAVSSVSSSSGGSSSHTTDLLLRIPANYAEVNDAIARASALDPADYEDFTAVTDAINAVNWDLKALYQSVVSGYADAINAAIDGLVKVTTEEVIEVVDPIEDTDTDTEVDETEPESEPEASEEANPTTGLMLSLIPMAIAAMAAVSSKRK